MKHRNIIAILAAAALLTGCATAETRNTPEPHHWAKSVQSADSKEAHLRLAEHYDDIAKTLEADAVEEKEMLAEYLARPWKFGKRIHDLKSQATNKVRDLEMAAKDSRKMAAFHRQMAAEAPK